MNVFPRQIQNYRIFIFAVIGFLLFEISFLYFGSGAGFSKLFLLAVISILVITLLANPFYSMLVCLFVLFSGITQGIEIPYSFFAIVALTGLSWLIHQTAQLKFYVRLDSQMLWVVGIFLSIVLSGFAAKDISVTLEMLLYFAKLAVLYFLIVQIIQTKSQLKIAFWVIIGSTLLSLTIGIISQLTNLPIIGQVEQGFRLRGLTGQPNVLALHLLIILPILLLYTFNKTRLIEKIKFGGLSLFVFLGFLGTFSRSALIGLIGVALTLLYILRRNHWLLISAVFTIVLALFLVPEIIWERIYSLKDPSQDPSLRWRINLFWGAINLFIQNPILGIGMGNFVTISHQFNSIHLATHNTLLEIATESGLVGLVFFSGFYFVSIKNFYSSSKYFKSNEKDLMIFSQGIFVSIVGIILFSLSHSIQAYFVIWAILGFGSCFNRIVKEEINNVK